MPGTMPLQYAISNWHQASKCLSNNSRFLKIVVTDFIQDNRLNGLRIQVVHDTFGVLFACVLNAKGSLISELEPNIVQEFTTDQIILELAKYGFLITYREYEKLGGNQIQYLMTLSSLHFDKIRILNVWTAPRGVKEFQQFIVAFNVEQNPDWLNAGYAPSNDEFVAALNNGSAFNATAISRERNYRWDWLYNWVADIDDIIADNADALTR